MNCKNCGNPINKADKFCVYCGEQNKKPLYRKILNNKVMLIMVVITHLLSVLAMTGVEPISDAKTMLYDVLGFVFMVLIMFIGNPFSLVALIFSILSLFGHKKWYIICCLVCSVLFVIPIFIFSAIGSIEGVGMFAPDNIAWVFWVPYVLLVLTCLLKVILKVDE